MTGCDPCKEYLPRFKRLAHEYQSRLHIRVVNIATADKRAQDAAIKFKVKATPTTLVLDSQDKILKRETGAITNKKIEALLKFAAG